MATKIVICSECRGELHYKPGEPPYWFHCEGGKPICARATQWFARWIYEIKGAWCGRDDPTAARREATAQKKRGA